MQMRLVTQRGWSWGIQMGPGSPGEPDRCGNVAAILELDEHLQKEFIIFEAAPQETRGIPAKKPVADYFL
ncbi:hypothetical protein DV515_00019566 [Chloebia gouldiae]|uniref:Uncharacterized protein n=1 Tax=Chloebia gouldiae TaxID=44316 RepID=A0A3L8Q4D7_CHLGU|nr:hypothetical protein DV515_00019566 [Chloebia gouldiae]